MLGEPTSPMPQGLLDVWVTSLSSDPPTPHFSGPLRGSAATRLSSGLENALRLRRLYPSQTDGADVLLSLATGRGWRLRWRRGWPEPRLAIPRRAPQSGRRLSFLRKP